MSLPASPHGGEVTSRADTRPAAIEGVLTTAFPAGCETEGRTRNRLRRGAITVLTGGGPIPGIMINAIERQFGPVVVLEEDKEPTSRMLQRRLRMLGPIEAAGQAAFGLLLRLLHKRSAARKAEIIVQAGLEPVLRPGIERLRIGSVNSDAARHALRNLEPDVVVVIGTRMISRKTLASVSAPFINYHAGLNPKYRGMNGGYWAFATGDAGNAGVTVHLVDAGVDTGRPLYWSLFEASDADNFVTYPILQTIPGRALLNRAIDDALNGVLQPQELDLPSQQWFHPTLWGYLSTGIRRGVW